MGDAMASCAASAWHCEFQDALSNMSGATCLDSCCTACVQGRQGPSTGGTLQTLSGRQHAQKPAQVSWLPLGVVATVCTYLRFRLQGFIWPAAVCAVCIAVCIVAT